MKKILGKLKKIVKYCVLFPFNLILKIFKTYNFILCTIWPALRGIGQQQFLDHIDKDIKEVKHGNISFLIHTPNQMCNFRHSTFSTKEPEILQWIEDFGNGVFFDIGANIGIYSLFYSQTKKGNIYSFEPSVFNLRQLAKNISLNKLQSKVTIISNPLSNKTGSAEFINGNSVEGGALNAFGVNYGFDGKPIKSNIKYTLLGLTLDDLYGLNLIKELPSLIKIDVDGIEHLILQGASQLLRCEELRSLYIEVNDEFHEQANQVKAILESAGFTLMDKKKSLMFGSKSKFKSTYNQIWIRN